MRIVLVHPTGANWIPGRKDVSATANRMAPLGLISIAAFLLQRGHLVYVHDGLGPDAAGDTASNGKKILSYHPDLVGISATTSSFLDGYDLSIYIKNIQPDVRIVFGGVHVSAIGARLLNAFAHIDYLCIGEGEETMAELASGRHPSKIRGLVWRDGLQTVANPHQPHIANLDDLPFPAYEKLSGFPKKYHLPLFSYIHTPGATMVTSRGCPYQCSYCDRSVFNRGYRYNSAAYVYAHMKYLRRRFNIRHINIYDDLFTTHRTRIVDLCRLLTVKPLGIQFNCAVRVGHADKALLEMLKNAGCLMISLGIESGNPDLLATHKTGVSLEAVRTTVSRIQSAGMRAKGLFMMGLPGETTESIRKTSDFTLELNLDDMNMSKFTPFPGAPVWNTIREKGCFDHDWRKMNCLNFVYIPEDIGSEAELNQLYNTHVKRFYSSPKWRRKFRRRLWEHRKSLWHLIRHLPSFASAKRTFAPSKVSKS